MSSVGGVGGGGQAQVLQQIQNLNQVLATAIEKNTDQAVKLTKLAAGQGVELQKQASFYQALDTYA